MSYIDQATDDDDAPEMWTARDVHVQFFERMKAAGFDFDKADKYRITALYRAAECGDVREADALIKAGVCDVDKADNNCFTPLYVAVQNGHFRVADVLIKAKCDVDKADDIGCTPLCLAAQKGHGGVADALIKAGCDVDKADNYGCTPLYLAVENGHVMAVEALLRAGSDTSNVTSIPALMVGFFVAHLEEQQSKMEALAGGLHRQLGAESVVSRLDGDLLEMILEMMEQRSVVLPIDQEEDEVDDESDDAADTP